MSLGGEEYLLRHGEYTAVVTQVGAGLRLLRHGERDLVLGYRADEVRPRYRGALLVPWPNRVVDGTYTFDGESFQLDLNEPERHHAIHGLVTWCRFDRADADDTTVTLTHALVPRPGYPFRIEVGVRYRLHDGGLTCSVSTRNVGDRRAPYGVAAHPYLVAGPGPVDRWTLQLPAERVLEVTPDRLVPRGLVDVAATGFDFRRRREIGPAELDHAFTSLVPDDDGLARVRVLDGDGASGVECAWDPAALPWVQVHTADLPDPSESRRGLAVEPMSCPPDAFNSGADLVVLEPGSEHQAEWTLGAVTGSATPVA